MINWSPVNVILLAENRFTFAFILKATTLTLERAVKSSESAPTRPTTRLKDFRFSAPTEPFSIKVSRISIRFCLADKA